MQQYSLESHNIKGSPNTSRDQSSHSAFKVEMIRQNFRNPLGSGKPLVRDQKTEQDEDDLQDLDEHGLSQEDEEVSEERKIYS